MSEEPKVRARYPRGLYEVGSDPDPRYSLANVRTFLAWIGASLALLAAGALDVLAEGMRPELRLAASLVLVVSGVATPVQAWFGWIASERAMRMGRPLPAPALAAPIALAVGAAGALIALGLLL